MYSYEARIRAVRLYIEYDLAVSLTIRELGYPSRRMLRSWYREFIETGQLHRSLSRRHKYSEKQKKEAVEYYFAHGRRISKTVAVLGYPNRETLRLWIDQLRPGSRKVSIKRGSAVSFSEERKRRAVIDLCSRQHKASLVAKSHGVTRTTLYAWKAHLLAGEGRATMKKKDPQPPSEDRDELLEELESLRKRVHRLQLEHDILTKANELLKKERGINPHLLTNREKTVLIDALRTTYALSELLRPLRIAKSCYFYHRRRLRRPDKYADLRNDVKQIFFRNRSCYGYRRVHAVLKRSGKMISEKIIRRVMAAEELTAGCRRRRKYRSYQGEVSPAVPNVIQRNFHAYAPNEKWLTDITEFQISAGKVYLSPIIDCFDGMVVSWTIGTSPDAEMVNAMLDEAVAGLCETEKPLVHTDRGAHYRWPGWISRMRAARLTRSMSRKGYTPDNAACEGFFGRLKNEMYYHRDWSRTTIDDFLKQIDEYIRWYNRDRIKMSLGAMSPAEFRASLGNAA